ncbi:MAG: metal ABC transporter ATP-binding protein [Snowella sp.]|nr:metal ABC transporter ATP-binding protein [Snowella sp.]
MFPSHLPIPTSTITESDAPEIISIRNLWANYGVEMVLENINLSVRELDFLGIIGPNGGGKTTLLKVLLGLHQPAQGNIQILGKPVEQGRKYIGYVPQFVNCDHSFPISVWDVVKMGRLGKRRLFQRYTKQDNEKVAEVLNLVDLYSLRHRAIGELSGGQRQRVYIARALATEPKILILDEPTASVDPQIRTSIYSLLEELNQWITILMISHDVGAIARYVKTVGCLNRRLHYHREKLLTQTMLEEAYQCPVDLIAHGLPHRVFSDHSEHCHEH